MGKRREGGISAAIKKRGTKVESKKHQIPPPSGSMSGLHLWFSRLRWSLDVLLRFYDRHAFVCALHKETKLLFDELVFCLQRLYSIPFR